MSDRSVLRIRARRHSHSDRKIDMIVEVLRDGRVVATIYGSREGLHIVSERLDRDTRNAPFWFSPPEAPTPGYVVPLLGETETCPWCADTKMAKLGEKEIVLCPVCRGGTF